MPEVKFLLESSIEAEAIRLIAAYNEAQGIEPTLPVPVEEILESHLNLSLDFDNLQQVWGCEDALGGLSVEAKQVFVDQSLDPDRYPNMEGRYRFTLAHELGHWQLHRHYYQPIKGQLDLFKEQDRQPSVVCRESQAHSRREWQANQFSAFLLMPTSLIRQCWESQHNGTEPFQVTKQNMERKRILLNGEIYRRGLERVVTRY